MITLGMGVRQAPLTRQQLAILLAQLRAPESSAYHEPFVLTLDGALDRAALIEAIRTVLQRHDILRTTYSHTTSAVLQQVRELDRFELDGTGSWDADLVEPFDLSTQAPIRFALRRIEADRHELLVVRHHIATDGWSLGILLRDLATGYAEATGAGSAGPRQHTGPGSARQYTDVAQDQQSAAATRAAAADLQWWQQELSGRQLHITLPKTADGAPDPATQTVQVTVAADTVAGLQAAARACAVSDFTLLLTLAGTALACWLPTGPVPIGVAVGGRDTGPTAAADAELVGCFSSVLPVVVDVQPGSTVREQAGRVAAALTGLLAHSQVDPAALAADCGLPSAVLAYQAVPEPAPVILPGLVIGLRSVQPPDAKCDLLISVTPTRTGDWQLVVRTRRAQVADEVGRELAAGLQQLCGAVAGAADRALAELLVGADRELPTLAGPGAGPALGADVAAAVLARGRADPDAIAVSCGSIQLSYRALLTRAARLAAQLRALPGVQRYEAPVLCWLAPGPALVVAELAALLSGASFVPQDRRTPWSVVAALGRRIAAPVLLTDGPVPGLLPAGTTVIDVTVADETVGAAAAAIEPVGMPKLHPELACYLIFTSGSTGEPKGVQVSHRALLELIEDTSELLAPQPRRKRWSCLHSPAFDFAVWEVWAPLTRGEQVVFIPAAVVPQATALAGVLAREQIDVLSQTPAAFARLVVAADAPDLASWSRPATVVLGGDKLAAGQVQDWFGRGAQRVVNLLGITEITVHGTAQVLTAPWPQAAADSPVGALLARRTGRLITRFGNCAPDLAEGELLFSGSGLARGYLGRPDLTAAAFVPAWWGPSGSRAYRSGDLLAQLPGRGLDYRRRRDDQLSLRGYRIEPGEVQSALLAVPGIRAAAVALAGTGDDAFLAAWLVTGPAALDLRGLRARLADRLPAFLVPAAFVVVEELPLTANGKVDPNALPPVSLGAGLAGAGAGSAGTGRAETDTERRLQQLWSEVTGASEPGLDDRLIDLGAHSLVLLRLADAVYRVYGVEFGLAQLFGIGTLGELAAEIERLVADDGGRPTDLDALVELLVAEADGVS